LVLYVAGLGLPLTLSRYLASENDDDRLQEGFYGSLGVVFVATLACSILIALFSSQIANAFFGGAMDIVRVMAIIIFLWSLDTMFLSFFRARQQMVKYGLSMLASRFAEIGIIAFLVLNGFGLVNIFFALVCVRAVMLLALWLVVRSQIGFKFRLYFDVKKMKEYLNFGTPTVPINLAAWVTSSSDRYIIGYFVGVASVGAYSVGYNLVSIILMLISVFGFVLPPALSKLYDEGRMIELKNLMKYSLKYFLTLAIPFAFGVSVMSVPILRLFSTPEIAEQNKLIVPLLSVSVLLVGVFSIVYNNLILTMKMKLLGAIWIGAAIINVGLNLLLVPRLGMVGAALGSVGAFLLVCLVGSYYSLRDIRFDIDWSSIAKAVIASMVMGLALWFISPMTTTATILTILGGIMLYVVVMILLKGFTNKEIIFLKEFAK